MAGKGGNTLWSLINSVVRICNVSGGFVINAKLVRYKRYIFLKKWKHTRNYVLKVHISLTRCVFHETG